MDHLTSWPPRNQVSDLRGVSRLAVDGTASLTELIEATHLGIARLPAGLGGPLVEGAVHGIAGLVCATPDPEIASALSGQPRGILHP